SQPVVILNGWPSIKDAFSKDEILGRPRNFSAEILLRNKENFAGSNGKIWKEERRFAFRVFRDLGYGKQVMESNIKDEIGYLLNEIEKRESELIDLDRLLDPSVSNNICYLVFGRRYDYDDPIHKLRETFVTGTFRLLVFTTWLFPFILNFHKFLRVTETAKIMIKAEEFENLIEKEVEKHEKDLNPADVRNYVDAYLVEMNERKKRGEISSFSKSFLVSNSIGLFAAGSDTGRSTLLWLFKMISLRTDIQEKVCKEIDSVIGKNRLPSWDDRRQMPYTQAVINEIQRWACVVPLNLPRKALADTSILGHFIPKGTTVIANFWAVNRDENLWQDPNEFNPNRFLSEDGREVINTEPLIPFSYGKRACVGEILARFELFLYFTSIMQKYKVELPFDYEINFKSEMSLTLQ
ncbi:Cytochrome P450 2J6-like protein, partial [Dinothrombium tinctorium]